MSVKVKDLLNKVRLHLIYGDENLLEKEIQTSDISRPGLEMTAILITTYLSVFS